MIYTSLDKAQESIRLLCFSYEEDGYINCQLTSFPNVENAPEFIAVSYAWGDPEPKSSVRLNGSEIQVRDNLFAFLSAISELKIFRNAENRLSSTISCNYVGIGWNKALERCPCHPLIQSPSRWHYFWIDALCIDQSSPDEKNHQVKLMGRIYSSAVFVLGWLGRESNDSQVAMHFMATNPDYRAKTSPRLPVGPQNPNSVSRPAMRINSKYDKTFESTVPKSAIGRILQNPYFTRLWIVQEFVLAKDLLFASGGDYVSVTAMIDYMQALDPYPGSPLKKLVAHRYFQRDQPYLYQLFLDFETWQCSEMKDRIFGMLGMAESQIQADYSLTTMEIYHAVLKEAIILHRQVGNRYGMQLSWKEIYEKLTLALNIDEVEGTAIGKEIYRNASWIRHWM